MSSEEREQNKDFIIYKKTEIIYHQQNCTIWKNERKFFRHKKNDNRWRRDLHSGMKSIRDAN